MGIILWLIFGGLIGWVASMIMGTNASQGLILNILVGIIGAVIGGLLMSLLGQSSMMTFNLYSFLVALLGAVVFLGMVKLIAGMK